MIQWFDIGAVLFLGSGLLYLCHDSLMAMVRLWSDSPMYSYAYTVPFFSLFIVWTRRDEFRRHALKPARLAALPVLAAGLVLFVLGQLGAVQLLQDFAFLIVLAGIVLYLFGIAYFKVAAPALGYLLFMIPFWDIFTDPLHWPFQQNSARLGVALLHLIGIPVHRTGTIISLPNLTVEVARACSGVNYLVAVLALALPLAFIRLRRAWKRVVLIASAVSIAALANGLRVALICALAYWDVGSPLHGPFHVLHGLFVAGIGYVVLFAGLRFLENDADETPAPPCAAVVPSHGARWRLAEAVMLAAVLWATAFLGVGPSSTPVALAQPLEALPRQFGDWFMVPGRSASEDLGQWQQADQRLRRSYRTNSGLEATVDVSYFETQSQSRELIDYRVADLHRQASPHPITLPGSAALQTNVVRWPERGEVGLFWYDVSGDVTADQYRAKILAIWHALTVGHSNAAAVMLRMHAPAGAEASAVAALETLAVALQEKLRPYWAAPAAGARIDKT